ncbi:hypothetical protein J5N97_016661 [Dioscorea zingiberensis]|uniref:Uncharacterized protein n=1 Tax=Dioscorea zingiberensis TaxID=325984 RepID=A0A9D5CJZ7_9LILI|nr:hypothetical protein J5N97_016661 [Dioscorea zingiberensis]
MGNCLKLREARTWVDDEDWDFVDSESMKQLKEEEKKGETAGRIMTGEKPRVVSASSTKVKIKLTKKQLEELSQLLETHGLQIEQALTQFINKSNIMSSREHGSQIVAKLLLVYMIDI